MLHESIHWHTKEHCIKLCRADCAVACCLQLACIPGHERCHNEVTLATATCVHRAQIERWVIRKLDAGHHGRCPLRRAGFYIEMYLICRLHFSGGCKRQGEGIAGTSVSLHAEAREGSRSCELQHRMMALWASFFQSCPVCLQGRYRPFQTLGLSTTETSTALQNGAGQRPWEREP